MKISRSQRVETPRLRLAYAQQSRLITVSVGGLTVNHPQLLPGREKHLLDYLTMAAMASSGFDMVEAGDEIATRHRPWVETPNPRERWQIG